MRIAFTSRRATAVQCAETARLCPLLPVAETLARIVSRRGRLAFAPSFRIPHSAFRISA